MAANAKAATAAKSPLNVRLTADDLALMDALVGIEKKRMAGRVGSDAVHLDVTRASVIRRWIHTEATDEGLLKPAKKPAKKGGA